MSRVLEQRARFIHGAALVHGTTCFAIGHD
jgi:hypothetical protein